MFERNLRYGRPNVNKGCALAIRDRAMVDKSCLSLYGFICANALDIAVYEFLVNHNIRVGLSCNTCDKLFYLTILNVKVSSLDTIWRYSTELCDRFDNVCPTSFDICERVAEVVWQFIGELNSVKLPVFAATMDLHSLFMLFCKNISDFMPVSEELCLADVYDQGLFDGE